MTQNVPPGIDFSNDPLLQGRNFSYLDTQLKRLGSPNFTHLPINAPKCPFHHFQQDGHMAMRNPVGRVNYQPNSFGEGPRESPQRGFRSFADVEEGPKRPAARRELRRSLQPGAAVLHQPDRGRAAPHRRGADLRTEQGEDAGHPRADGRRICSTSTRRWPARSPTSSACRRCPSRPMRPMPTRQDLDAVAGAQHHRERAGALRRPQARHSGHRRHRCGAPEGAARRRSTKEGATFEIIAPKVGGVEGQRRQLDRGRPDDRRRPVGAVRRGRAAAGGGCHRRSAAGVRRRAISSPTPSRIASSSAT